MPVYKDKKRNTWYVSLKIKDPITNEFKSRKKRGFETKHEAKLWENSFINTSHSMNYLSSSITFKDVSKRWEDYIDCSEHMRQKHEEHFKIRFKDYYETPISKITKQQLMEWRIDLSKSKYSTSTKNHTLAFVKAVFNYANDFYNLPNPSKLLKPFKPSDSELMKEMQVWTTSEFNRFVDCLPNEIYKTFFELLFWTGMRKGEATALQKTDLKGDMLWIHGTKDNKSKDIRPTKTKQNRKIKIDSYLLPKLQALANRKGKYLFGDDHSLRTETVRNVFEKAIKKSGVKRIRIHDLRHSHATWLINNGVNIVAVSKRLGHSTINQTLKTYTHLLPDSEEELINFINTNKKA